MLLVRRSRRIGPPITINKRRCYAIVHLLSASFSIDIPLSASHLRAGSSPSPSHIPVPDMETPPIAPPFASGFSSAEDSPMAKPPAVRPRREGDPAAALVLPPNVRDGLSFSSWHVWKYRRVVGSRAPCVRMMRPRRVTMDVANTADCIAQVRFFVLFLSYCPLRVNLPRNSGR